MTVPEALQFPEESLEARQTRPTWRRVLRFLGRLWPLYLAAAILAGTAWLLVPLREAEQLPAPRLPSYTPAPPDVQEAVVLGPTAFVPGTTGAVRVIAWDGRTQKPLSDAQVHIVLAPRDRPGAGSSLFSGVTDEHGTVPASFSVPDVAEGGWDLVVDVLGPVGAQRVVRPVTIRRTVFLSLTTDRRTYRPGETIHVWLRALGQVDHLTAAGDQATVTVENARGSRVCEEMVTTSPHGTAHVTCALVDRAASGSYRVVATLYGAVAERELRVETRTASALRVTVAPSNRGYVPGQLVEGVVEVKDRYGRAVPGATVDVKGVAGDPEREVLHVRGATKEDGSLAFAAAADSASESFSQEGTAAVPVRLVAQASDGLARDGRDEAIVWLSAQPLSIEVWPESAALKPGLENLLRVQVRYPDGGPATCSLDVLFPGTGHRVEAETDETGYAQVPFVPTEGGPVAVQVAAQDAIGQETQARFELPVEQGEDHILLRSDRETYRAGDVAEVYVLASVPIDHVYVDIVAEGQSVAVHAAPVVRGRASLQVLLPEMHSGSFELNAYAVRGDGTMLRDARRIAVARPDALDVWIKPDRERYEVGAPIRTAVRVRDEHGWGGESAVALLAIADPGIEAPPGGVRALPKRDAVPAVDLAPQQAEAASRERPMPADVQDRFRTYERLWTRRRGAFTLLADRMLWALSGLSAVLLAVSIVAAWRSQAQQASLRRLAEVVLGGIVALPFAAAVGLLLAYLVPATLGTGATLALALAWFGALVSLLVWALTRSRGWSLVGWSLIVAALALTVGLRYALVRGADPTVPWLSAGWVAAGAGTLSLCIAGVAMLRAREWGGAASALALAVLLASTWLGSMTAAPGTHVPVQEELPELERAIPYPTRVPVQVPPSEVIPVPVQGQALPAVLGSGAMTLWVGEAETDTSGHLTVDLPVVRRPGNVELVALAVTENGAWGASHVGIDVDSSLLVEHALPAQLTVGDRLDLPVSLHSGVPVSQTVQLTVTKAPWFRFHRWGAGTWEAEVPADGSAEIALPIQVLQWGEHTLTMTVQAAGEPQVITGSVSVQPGAKQVASAFSWWTADRDLMRFRIPWSAVRGTDQITVRLSSGPQSVAEEAFLQVVSGRERSFDQLAPAIEARRLYADHLLRTGRWRGQERAELESEIAADYQRLLSFEAPGGGFSAFGGHPADLYRTAYALRCLAMMADLVPVEGELLDRTAQWLFQQQRDGAWFLETVDPSWSHLDRAELPVTAYVVWSLIDAGYGSRPGLRAAVAHLERYLDGAEDAYVLALVANALVSYGEPSEGLDAALARLADQAVVQKGLALWPTRMRGLSGAAGHSIEADGYRTPSIKTETVALATHALLRAGAYPERAAQGLAMLIDSRDVHGTWGGPQTTSLALHALLSALAKEDVSPADVLATSTVTATVGERAQSVVLRGDTGETLTFEELDKGYNSVAVAVDGPQVAYQVVSSYALPWGQVPPPLPEEEDLSIQVSYDRTAVRVGETLTVTVSAMLNVPGVAPLVAVELGLPPGFALAQSDLEALRDAGTLADYGLEGERLIVHLLDLSSTQLVRFVYHLSAMYPVSVSSGQARAYDVANPQRPAVREPVRIEAVRD